MRQQKKEKKVQGLNLDVEVIDYLTRKHIQYQSKIQRSISFSQFVNKILLSYKIREERKASRDIQT